MLKLVSPRLETQTDTTLHIRECCSERAQEGLQQFQKWPEPGRQAPGLSWKVHSAAKFNFHL
jgi:hypothetical protein